MLRRFFSCRRCFVLLLCVAAASIVGSSHGHDDHQYQNVTYDGRSLIINGRHELLFSGSIHYPRSTPEMWPSLIAKAKRGGLDVIQTYVFWNLHEPTNGKYDFSGRYDLIRFIREVQSQGLHVGLRIGPFIESEWTYGGIPIWLHDVPGIVFRSDNEPFKYYMQRFVTKIVNMMKSENLYASQGGPIILSQIENEYQMVEPAFHEKGPPYVIWAANMALDLGTGVPWVMCKQDDAPGAVINACNGMKCGETFKGPNSPDKPSIWTEDWTSFYQVWGGKPYLRSAQDIAFHAALFVAKNGSYVNYYMYHGGTNFGRTAAEFMVTSYYDEAPLDEYGLEREPKWGHLKELHAAIKLCSRPLLNGAQRIIPLGQLQQAYVFEEKSGDCAAFLVNNDEKNATTVLFRNIKYELPRKSISILPDCRTVAFNTEKVSTQYSKRSMTANQMFDSPEKWEEYREEIPSFDRTSLRAKHLLDQISTAKDASDYLWYTFRFPRDSSSAETPQDVRSHGHALHEFVNGEYAGSAHGSHGNASFTMNSVVHLRKGVNEVALLSVTVGLPDSGAFLEQKVAGVYSVKVQNKIFTNYSWGYQVGLIGEKLQIYSNLGSNKVQWSRFRIPTRQLTWYKTVFSAPAGNDPVALNLNSMGKGEAWVNGQSIGRYWVSFKTSKGNPSQSQYHIPRAFLKPTGNLLVLLEEEKGNPLGITLETVAFGQVCGHVTQSHLPPLSSWITHKQKGDTNIKKHRTGPTVQLNCPTGKNISKILFASFGNPVGDCEHYAVGSCHSSHSQQIVEKACVGKSGCSIPLRSRSFNGDPCPGIHKALLVDAQCT